MRIEGIISILVSSLLTLVLSTLVFNSLQNKKQKFLLELQEKMKRDNDRNLLRYISLFFSIYFIFILKNVKWALGIMRDPASKVTNGTLKSKYYSK